jgi:hypothetical protein
MKTEPHNRCRHCTLCTFRADWTCDQSKCPLQLLESSSRKGAPSRRQGARRRAPVVARPAGLPRGRCEPTRDEATDEATKQCARATKRWRNLASSHGRHGSEPALGMGPRWPPMVAMGQSRPCVVSSYNSYLSKVLSSLSLFKEVCQFKAV